MWRWPAIFLLVMVTVALIAPPQASIQNARPDQHGAAEIRKSSPATVSLVQNAVEPAFYKQPCHNSAEDRQSDLCAQWKSANWTKVGAIAAIFGIAALVVQIGFTWRALDHSERTLDHARQASRAGLRPWLVYEKKTWQIVGDLDEFVIHMNFINVGKSPAVEVIPYLTSRILPVGAPRPVFDMPPLPPGLGATVGPNRTFSTSKAKVTGMWVAHLMAKQVCLWLYAFVRYEDPGDKGTFHESEITVRLTCTKFEKTADDTIDVQFESSFEGPSRLT